MQVRQYLRGVDLNAVNQHMGTRPEEIGMARNKVWDWHAELTGAARRRTAPFPTLGAIEIVHIEKVLQAYQYNFVHAAKALGISRATLYRKMHREVCGPKVIARRRLRLRAA